MSLATVLVMLLQASYAQKLLNINQFDFFGHPVSLSYGSETVPRFNQPATPQNISAFYRLLTEHAFSTQISTLKTTKEQLQLNDWLYYQLIRKTAQAFSPKTANYTEYTLYKWFLLCRSGFDALLRVNSSQVLFYVQTNDTVFNLPGIMRNGKQYICLNYHDYDFQVDFEHSRFEDVWPPFREPALTGFSYKITRLPDFSAADYTEKELRFSYHENEFRFRVKMNTQIKNIFANYPAVDYGSILNIPLSGETYASLIPLLQQQIKGLPIREGVNYLLHFTRYAFGFAPDTRVFGREKRFSPEQTLLYDNSDCEDRVALFFCLVKELYNLPMIVLTYPEHVTIAVKFDKPVGKPIFYNGVPYTVCEPTPQSKDLKLGQLMPNLATAPYEVVYAYQPTGH